MFNNVKQQGLSLVEVLVAVLVLGLGMVGVLKFQVDLMRSGVEMAQYAEGLHLAQDKIDNLSHYVALRTADGSPSYDEIVSSSFPDTIIGTTTNYSVSWVVTDVADPPHKVVTVTVAWTDPRGDAQSISISTIVGENVPGGTGQIS